MPTKYSRTKIVTDTSSLISLQTGDILELSLELFDIAHDRDWLESKIYEESKKWLTE